MKALKPHVPPNSYPKPLSPKPHPPTSWLNPKPLSPKPQPPLINGFHKNHTKNPKIELP